MRIIVTGGCGFIGSHVVELLLSEGNKVMVIDNLSTGKRDNLDEIRSKERLSLEVCDVRSINTMLDVFQKVRPEAVIHLAAQPAISTSMKSPYMDAHTNILGTINVTNLAQDYGARRVVLASTSAVYQPKNQMWGPLKETDYLEPDSAYGLSKMAAEQYMRMFFHNHVILRFGNVYGPRQVPLGENQVVARMIGHFLKGDFFQIHGDGKQKRDFVYVRDVAEAVAQALHGTAGTYNIAGGKAVSVMEVAAKMEEIFDIRGYRWEYSTNHDSRGNVHMDIHSAAKNLIWKPRTSLEDGLKRTVEWWRGK